MLGYINSVSEFSEAFLTCAGVTEEKCMFTSSTLSFQQTSSHAVSEGGTRGMSLEGSQTGNSSGCFHDLLVFRSAHVNVFTGASFRAYQCTLWENHKTFFSTVHKDTARVLSPSCGGMSVKRKSSVTLKVTQLNVISTFLALNDSISFVAVIFSTVDWCFHCVREATSFSGQIFTLASASMLGNTGGKTLWVWKKNVKHAETVKHKWAKRNNSERDGSRLNRLFYRHTLYITAQLLPVDSVCRTSPS